MEQENYRKCQRERNSSHPGCFEVAPLIKQERYRKNLAKLIHQSQRPFFMKSTTSYYNKVKKFNEYHRVLPFSKVKLKSNNAFHIAHEQKIDHFRVALCH